MCEDPSVFRRGPGRAVVRSPWTPIFSLVLLLFALVGFSVLGQDAADAGGPVGVAAYLALGAVSMAFALRGLFRRMIIEGRTVTVVGWWRSRRVQVRLAEPVVIDDRMELLYVWAPQLVTPDGDVLVLSDLAGFSWSEHRPNRRVERVCARLADARDDRPTT